MERLKIPENIRVAVIDDETITLREIKRGLLKDGYEVEIFTTGEEALKTMDSDPFDLVLCDLKLPKMDGNEVLKKIKEKFPDTEVIIITGHGTINNAIETIQSGAFHFVTKPVKLGEIRSLSARALEKVKLTREKEVLKQSLFSHSRQQFLIGHSKAIQDVLELVKKVCSLNCNVLIHGESGTGKELVARALHYFGERREKPFIAFNCGGFSEELIANELFGHEKGAYTGAVDTKIGLLESANKGTIFLDEVGIMPDSMQIKLLRFLQERTLIRLGGTKPIPLDVRIVSAGNKDLKKGLLKKKFREDLYYRLNVVQIDLPPLRDRKEDIPLLINHFLKKYSMQFGKAVASIEPDVEGILESYPYPGNVRELENIIERAVALSEGRTITTKDLPGDLLNLSVNRLDSNSWPSLEELERDYIRKVLKKTGNHKGNTAEILKIPRTSLWRKIKNYRLDSEK